MPSVVYVITSSGAGGAETQVSHLARSFRSRGWDVAVITMLPLDEPFTSLEALGVRLATLGMTRGIPDPRAMVRLRTLLRRWRPDVVHGHMVHANLLVRLSRLVVPIPVAVSTIHNQDEGSPWRYRAYRLTDRLSDLTTTVSTVALEESIRRGAVGRNRIVLVPNGLDVAAYRQDAEARERTRQALGLADRFIWLAVGRLDRQKDYPSMLTAFRRLRDHEPRAVLLIAGSGPVEGSIRAVIEAEGLAADVRLLGLRSDVPALMQAADGFVMSSAWEGLPMVLLESAASALPIVATDVGGSREAVIDGVTGYLVAPADAAGLASAMARVMAMSDDDRRTMGTLGRGHATRAFDLEAVTDAWERLYLDRLHRAGAGTTTGHA